MKIKISITIVTIGILIILKCWIGIYADDEWGEKRLFIKHRPIWKSYFYSPRGMRDWELSKMPIEYQKEQLYFDEFVLKIIPEDDQ